MLHKIRIVLVETSHPGNIGAVARAMLNMGLMELYLVNPKHKPNDESIAMASGADKLLANIIIVKTLDEALVGIEFVVGSSARTRKVAIPVETVRCSAKTVCNYVLADSKCAIVFGRERTGLYNDELLKCHQHAYIPANENYSSLNLAQAVQVFSYELRCTYLESIKTKISIKQTEERLATSEQNEGLYVHFEEMLYEVGFLRKVQPGLVMSRIKRLFQRAKLENIEVNILRGICKEVLRKVKKQSG